MIIQINKNLDKYKETVAAGLNLRQIIHIIMAAGVSVAIVLSLFRFIGVTGAALCCFPPVGVIALNGFSPDTMRQVRCRFRMMFVKPLKYSSDSESEKVIEQFYIDLNREKAEELKRDKKAGKKPPLSFFKKNKKGVKK